MTRRPRLLLLGIVALVPGCGHRGDPLPPLRKTPPAPAQFRLAQRGDVMELSAVAPAASIDGVPYPSLTLEFLHTTGQGDLDKTGARLAVHAVPGTRSAVTLPLPAPGTSLRAAVRAVANGEKGPKTVTAAMAARATVEAPRELSAVLGDDGVSLAWRGPKPQPLPTPTPAPAAPGAQLKAGAVAAGSGAAPQPKEPPPTEAAPTRPPAGPATTASAPAGAIAATPPATAAAGKPVASEPVSPAESKPRTSGFLVYRRVGSGPYAAPLEAEPLDRRSFNDAGVPLGASVCYVVRAAASADPLVESAASNEACLETRDVSAPATPTGLVILPRPGGIELLWSPSREEDLAGYRIYRAATGEAPVRLAELPVGEASYVDATAEKGRRYAYTLAAFDHAGNESAPSEPVEASLP